MNLTADILSFMLPPREFMKSFHLASAQEGVNPMFTAHRPIDNDSGWIYYCKSGQGYPWDINYYNRNYVYQCVTESEGGWDDPTSYKAFASKSWPDNHGGIVWSPRYLGELPYCHFCITEDSSYKRYKGGELAQPTQNLGGPIVTLVQGPYRMAVGRLGPQSCIVLTYQWGKGLHSMEQNVYAQGYGWVRWRLFALMRGVYELEQDSTFDLKTAGGSVEPVFPNPLP